MDWKNKYRSNNVNEKIENDRLYKQQKRKYIRNINIEENRSEENYDYEIQQIQKQKRRKKISVINNDKRIYACGCGKSYLSYPALYTHLKQKHNGQVPDGTQFPNTLGKGKKGRPKNSDKIQLNNFEDNLTDLSEESIDPLSEIVYYLKGKTIKKEDNFSINALETKYDLIQSFPLTLFKENIEDFLPIYNNLKTMIEQKDQLNDQNYFLKEEEENKNKIQDSFKEGKQITCNKIFSQFLIQVSQYINREIYRELCIFVCLYRKILNKHGWKIKQQYLQKQGQDISFMMDDYQKKEFCQENDGELIPSINNIFINETAQIFENQLKDQEYILFKSEKSKDKNNIIFLTNHFINWLYNKGYTSQDHNFSHNNLVVS